MKKNPKSDTDVIIEVLEAARLQGQTDKLLPDIFTTEQQVAIAMELIHSQLIDATTTHNSEYPLGHRINLNGITTRGRQFLEETKAKRDAKRWPARFRRGGLVFGGWLVGLLTANAKDITEFVRHFFSH